MNIAKLCIVIFSLNVTLHVSADLGRYQSKEAKEEERQTTENEGRSVLSRKAREKEELRKRVLKRSTSAYENFKSVDPKLSQPINKRPKISGPELLCFCGVITCSLLICYSLKRKW